MPSRLGRGAQFKACNPVSDDSFKYCGTGNIREVLIFANSARKTNSRIQEFRENHYYNSATKEKRKFANSKLREKSKNQKFHDELNTQKLPYLQYTKYVIVLFSS